MQIIGYPYVHDSVRFICEYVNVIHMPSCESSQADRHLVCHPERRAKPEVELLRNEVSVAQAGHGIKQKRERISAMRDL